jgi:hypothetical protein
MRDFFRILSVSLLLVLFGCGSTASNTELTQTRDGLTATLAVKPASLAVMKPVVLQLTLREEHGGVVEGAVVQYDLTMPGMTMPKTSPVAVAEGGGRYRAQTLFTMSGDWRIEATVTRPGGVTAFSYGIRVQ